MHFLQYAWVHKPDALLERDFWPAVQTEVQSFTKHEGWWPHVLWQALFGEWSLKELTPQIVLRFGQNHFKIKFKIDFKIACGCGCVSAPNPFVPLSRSLKESPLRSNLWFGLRIFSMTCAS